MKNISVLGVTGSIGMQCVDVVKNNPNEFKIIGVAAGNNIEKLIEVIELLSPKYISVKNEEDALKLKEKYPEIDFSFGDEGLIKILFK